jgi:hypothetical protein
MTDSDILINALINERDFCKDVAKNIDQKDYVTKRFFTEFASLCDRLKNRIENNSEYHLGIQDGKPVILKK